MRLTSIHFLLLSFLLAGGAIVSRAQNPPVEFRGKIKSIKLNSEDKGYLYIDLKIEFEFLNKSERPVLLSKRKPWEYSQYIASSVENLSRREYLYRSSIGAGNDISPKWERYRRKLDRTAPPKKHFRYVLPKQSWRFEFETVLSITKIVDGGNGFTFLGNNKIDWSEMKSLPELWMTTEIPLWFSNIEPIADRDERRFGKKLREQWKQYGFLWLDDMESEPLRLDLKSALDKK